MSMSIRITKFFTKTKYIAIGLALLGLLGTATLSQPVYAADPKPCKVGEKLDPKNPCTPAKPKAGVEDSALKCSGGRDCGLVDKYVNPIINFLAIIVGLVVVISVVMGGVQYASSEDDPGKVAAAKSRIINAILGLLAFLFLYAFLQWIVPGGFL